MFIQQKCQKIVSMALMNYIGIDMDESHIPLAEARVKNWNPDLYKPQELFDS